MACCPSPGDMKGVGQAQLPHGMLQEEYAVPIVFDLENRFRHLSFL
jgi:hypothetical protein